ncbi:phosphatidic acid phosphatase [Arthrobacter jiangjiafuii]|uniref:Phosphatidic acid phosphatase n=1 Tax=Arthrobacter jiangjiafuii TaxID=2817475 RepID=A0A975M7A4_9MICC|nr:phosphatase PAP2 family protein [Arthrobacter jiangjiafuii]MBP3043704.1 phosphatidic acid phosphatase [Arthrobacter jiangjiafuii]QWC10736.1 phosphatidic acid phosphatase [Arthrobacter jiangjiafuii]
MPETEQIATTTTSASSAATRVARIVTETSAPAVLVGILLLLQPLLSPGVTWLQGIVAALFTVGLPFAGILWLKRRGRVTDHHVGVRTQRAPILAASAVSLGIGALILVLLDAPAELFGEIGGVFIGMMLCLAANLVWKLSVHSAVAAYVGLALLAPIPAVGAALALLLASATGWSRVKLGDHTPTQVLAGHLAGCLAFAAAMLLP